MARSRHSEIFETLKGEILSGKYAGNARFPSDNALARRFGAGRQTVYWAVSRLQDIGLVRRERGSGTFLTQKARRNGGAIAVIAPSFPQSEIFPVICKELSRLCQESGRLFCYADEHAESAKGALSRLKSSVAKMSEQGVAATRSAKGPPKAGRSTALPRTSGCDVSSLAPPARLGPGSEVAH